MEGYEEHHRAVIRRALALTGWATVLVAVVVGGDAVLVGPLAPPDVLAPGSWSSWAGSRAPLSAAFAVAGLTVVALAWYLLAATALQVCAHALGIARLVALGDVVTLPALRRSMHTALGLGLAGSLAAAGAPRSLLPETSAPAVLVAAAVPLEAEPPGSEPPVMRRLPDAGAEAGPGAVADPGPPPDPPDAWTVAPGDHLWSVAARVLEAAWGAVPSDAEVAPYWRRLVDANAERLADPANPDLVFPGQVLVVATPPAR